MSQERVPLHLTKPNPTGILTSLDRLVRQDVNRYGNLTHTFTLTMMGT